MAIVTMKKQRSLPSARSTLPTCAACIYQPYCHVYNSIKIMVGTFVSTIILSLHYFSKNTTG